MSGSVIDACQARDWVCAVLVRAGLREPDAACVADSLVFAELRGVITHGLVRLETYVRRIRRGGINAHAQLETVADLGGLVVLDADHGPGAASACFATDLVIARAREHGVACVVARNASHFGASAFYSNRMADAGLAGLVMCNTEPVMCAPSGGRPVLGTNPIAFTVPVDRERRPQLDMATTAVSQGKLILAEQADGSIPLGWAVDDRGLPTISAADGLHGALLPSGGPKGFGLAFMVDALLALGGAAMSPAVSALHGDDGAHQGAGHVFLALRADAALPAADYAQRIDELVNAVHDSGLPNVADKPMIPGEPELRHARAHHGRIALSATQLHVLRRLGASVDLPLPIAA